MGEPWSQEYGQDCPSSTLAKIDGKFLSKQLTYVLQTARGAVMLQSIRYRVAYCVMTVGAAILPIVMASVLVGCGGSDPVAPAPVSVSSSVTATIGPNGGTVTGPGGVQVEIPQGALNTDTTIGITRNPSGAPAPFDAGNAPAGPIYEFTPHDIVFNTPNTIRIPVPAGAVASQIFMASLGGNWAATNATAVGGFAVIQRNSFSFSLTAGVCRIPAGSPPDPHPCVYPSGGASIDPTSSATLTQIAPG